MLNVFLTRFEGFFFLMFTLKELVTALKPVSWRGGFKKKGLAEYIALFCQHDVTPGACRRVSNKDVIARTHSQQYCLYARVSKIPESSGLTCK